MSTRTSHELHYGSPAKTFHWLIVALLVTQYLIGWLMPNIHRGMQPGTAMMSHISFGVVILALTWTLLVVVGLHVVAALVHLFIYRDRVMARMLPTP
ncbi:MAG TPA: cytochrome b/b6 domain-containing protein [Xanthobacteraceae bacterium]|nr:cytochrome b/b6 domain-containing protein [Xanthobacteraceae bacterium]